jgi:lipopolysaccharide transport system ATP-binding protein
MSDAAIRVEGLGKQYRLGKARERYHTLRDQLARWFRNPIRGLSNWSAGSSDRTFWALKDISFEVKRGEVIGVIGRNGAGKSTLLKILSRITEPTEGGADISGRVGSLLEVGTGFNPELTGRENVFLNGAILGMRRKEISRKFDEIVAFAEVEKFIDTPVKHYSSGMYMRLAFAVAAHLEPEILIVDEVLAVGDAQFQKKCLGKMGEVARGGRTVLFVSHNMQAVQQLCTSGLILRDGRLVRSGTIAECVAAYTADATDGQREIWERSSEIPPAGPLSVQSVSATLTGLQPDHKLDLSIDLQTHSPHKAAFLAVDFHDAAGISFMQAIPTCTPFIRDGSSRQTVNVTIELPPLVPGTYGVAIWVGSHNTETYDQTRPCVSFTIDRSPTPERTFPHHPAAGAVVPKSWLKPQPSSEG